MTLSAANDNLPEISVNPAVLKWARQERALARADAARLLGIPESELAAYEDGSQKPNVTFLRLMSSRYQINFVSLLLPDPPSPIPKLQDFRIAPRGGRRGLALDTVVAIQDVRDALEAFAELRRADERLVPLPRLDTVREKESAEDLAARQRRKFGISVADQQKWPSLAAARNQWRALIEKQGVFVYLKPMDLDDCRGFSMIHDGLAAICVNDREESAGAETFTLWHEYCHLLRRRTGISDENRLNATERYCNVFAASFLIPVTPLRELLNSPVAPIDYTDHVVRSLAIRFKVSNRAMALRLEHTNLAPKGFYSSHTAAWDKPTPPKPMKGGPSAVERATRVLGKYHARTVLRAYRVGLLSPADAHRMLDVPIHSFGHLGAAVE